MNNSSTKIAEKTEVEPPEDGSTPVDTLREEKMTGPVDKTPVVENKSPNIKFVGKQFDRKENKKVLREEAPSCLISGPTDFDDLPSSEKQIAGFYYKRASELCRAFPDLYKPITIKGE